MFFTPKIYHLPIIILLLPLSIIYGIFMSIRRVLSSPKEFNTPIVSVGNLIVGGSGKTPFTIALARRYDEVFIISRGYGRESRGLVEVSDCGEILTTVQNSGDEPMLMAFSLPKASVIVSEDRQKAIRLAESKGARLIILDDGFNRVDIAKFEILLEPKEIKNPLPFPAGAFREFYFNRVYADIVAKEDREFQRVVTFVDLTPKMILATAISNPQRLDEFLPKGVVHRYYLEDHAYFDEMVLKTLLEKYQATSILCTSKDMVKMSGFDVNISEMKLEFLIEDLVLDRVDKVVKDFL